MELKEAVAKRMQALFDEKGVTVEEVALKTKLPVTTIKKILKAGYKKVAMHTVFVICRALGSSLDEFYGDSIFDNIGTH